MPDSRGARVKDAAHQVERRLCGARANLLAITGISTAECSDGPLHIDGDPHRADGLLRRAATGAGDAAEPNADVGTEARARTARHEANDRFAHGAVRGDHL